MSEADERSRPLFTISTVAKMFGVHPQTLRLYEREGLIQPRRSAGNTRLYSEQDLERLRLILELTRELGVNLAGVEVILQMRERLERMQREIAALLRYIRDELARDYDGLGDRFEQALVRSPFREIVRLRELEEEERESRDAGGVGGSEPAAGEPFPEG
jgi:MerR family transcriptional regulator/heat shock protein HspR